MIKQVGKSKINFVLIAVLIFFFSYITAINFAIPLSLYAVYFYFKSRYKNQDLKGCKVLYLGLLFVIIFSLANLITRQRWSVLYIPFSLVPLLTMVLFDNPEISLLMALAVSNMITALAGNNYHLGIFSLISGISAGLLARDARRRVAVIRAGLFVGIIQTITLFLIGHFSLVEPSRYLIVLVNGVVSGILVIGILPVFEYLFKTVTNISLLELADFNHPLLQRMVLEAPGTYHHSLIVGNLSEAACRVVGAHALLARVGAYYHDIGKLSKPDYFSENQDINASKHDTLSPTMSKLIIMNHVKEGMELAKKYKLNPILLDFIQQHHGSSLVFYFYRRALENLEDDQEIKEDGFRYPGPKPRIKEIAIVLLADSVEAASRALKDPSPEKIKEVVHKVINNKFIDGQLDECDLTLKELEKISAIFSHILGGIYHSRVNYPEEKEK